MSFTEITTITAHSRPVVSIKTSNNGLFATASGDKKSIIFSPFDGQHLCTLQGEHQDGLNDIVWLGDTHVVTSSDDKTLKLWDVEKEKMIISYSGHPTFIYSLSVLSLNQTIISGGYDGSIQLVDIRSNSCIMNLFGHSESISSLDSSPVNFDFCSSGHDGLVRTWDSRYFSTCKLTLYTASKSPMTCVRYSPSGSQLLVGSCQGQLRLVGLRNGPIETLKEYQGHINDKYNISASISTLFGHPIIASGSEDGQVYLWEANSSAPIEAIQGHSDVVTAVSDFSSSTLDRSCPDCIASAGLDGTVKLWGHNALHPPN